VAEFHLPMSALISDLVDHARKRLSPQKEFNQIEEGATGMAKLFEKFTRRRRGNLAFNFDAECGGINGNRNEIA
jgi:hypothetical protein